MFRSELNRRGPLGDTKTFAFNSNDGSSAMIFSTRTEQIAEEDTTKIC